MTDTEKANQILLAIYEELGKDSYGEIAEMQYTFSTKISENIGVDEFCQIMLKLRARELITGEHNDLLDKDSYFENVQLTKKGRKEGKRIMKEIKKTTEAKNMSEVQKEFKILHWIYKQTDGNVYHKTGISKSESQIENLNLEIEPKERILILIGLKENDLISMNSDDYNPSPNTQYEGVFKEIRLTKKGKDKYKSFISQKVNQILLLIYEENNKDIYEKILKIDETWENGIFNDVYEKILKNLEHNDFVVLDYNRKPEMHEGFKGFTNIGLSEKGIEKCKELLGEVKVDKNLNMDKVFIVHGHDGKAKSEAARFIEKLELEAIILHEQASSSRTIIEKIEKYVDVVDFGIVLYTDCDVGAKNEPEPKLKSRARQNVVFEHGYLMGKIKRSNVCALVKGDVETPSDIDGILYIPMDDAGVWKFKIAQEMKAVGYHVDMNKIS